MSCSAVEGLELDGRCIFFIGTFPSSIPGDSSEAVNHLLSPVQAGQSEHPPSFT